MMSAHRTRALLNQYGPWVVVTGASSGIGRAMALQLAQAGFNVMVVGRRPKRLNDVTAQIARSSNVTTRVVMADLATSIGVDTVEAACGDLDVGLLVAAAGFGTSGAFLGADLTVELEMLNVNCGALVGQCLSFGRRFAKRGRGGIILLASLVGFQGVPFSASYAASKAYVQSLAEALHVELQPLGIDVLACAPGPVRSGFEAARKHAHARGNRAGRCGTRSVACARAQERRYTWPPIENMAYSLAPLARPLRTRIMGRVMGDMTKHQRLAVALPFASDEEQ